MKQEIYEALSSLEQVKNPVTTPNYWQAIAYLLYCNECILNHEDEDFTKRLIALIDNSKDDTQHCSCNYNEQNGWPYADNFYRFPLSPEGVEKRDFLIEFFPSGLRKTIDL